MVQIHLPLLFQDVGKFGIPLAPTRSVGRRNEEIVGSNPTVLIQHFHNHSGVAKR